MNKAKMYAAEKIQKQIEDDISRGRQLLEGKEVALKTRMKFKHDA